jgi:competence protein ComEC
MVAAECYFLDVGQGTANVILLGDRRAIVIDCGPAASIPLKLLRRYVDRIVALIVSHNDKDHHGGAAQILAAYPKAVDCLYFLQDRPLEKLYLYAVAKHERESGNLLNEPVRLERQGNPCVLYADPQANFSLELFFPTFQDNLDAQRAKKPNATSAVVVLFCGQRKIVYPGDASVDEWQRIYARLGAGMRCDALAVPHHGGHYVPRRRGESVKAFKSRVTKELSWLYSTGVRPAHAIVSVGTSNGDGHPNSATIKALSAAGTTVLCTQITAQCCENLERLRPGVIRLDTPSRSRPSQDLTSGGRSRNVGCAGTVIVELSPTKVVLRRLRDHQDAVDRLAKTPGGRPLCR